MSPSANDPRRMSGTDLAISIRNVAKTFPPSRRGGESRTALAGVSLDIPHGQWLALLGPNGCGKSTLLKAISLTHAPASGTIDGLDTSDLHHAAGEARRAFLARLGVVFQEPALDSLLTIRENLHTQAALVGLSRSDAARRIGEVSESLSITPRLDERVKTLSGGLRRRADLARALLHSPDLLLLDEATTGLDLAARREFWDLIRDLRRRQPRMTIIATTHLMDEAEAAQMVAMMSRGRIARVGTPAEIRASIGKSVIRVPVGVDDTKAREILAAHRIESRVVAGVLTSSVAEVDAAAEAVRTLAASGVAFEFGPPTLGDAYLAITGEGLETGNASSDAEAEA